MLFGEPVANLRPLFRRRLACVLVGLDDQVRFRSLRAILPDLVDRVAGDRHQLGAAARKRFLRFRHPVARVQPRIVADARAFRRVFLEPLRGARLRYRLVAPLGRTDLLSDLERVASVDENRGFLGKYDGRSGRSLEAGQPGQPLGVAADIFAHMLVGQRYDEAVELVGLELLAKSLQAICVCGHKLSSIRATASPTGLALKVPTRDNPCGDFLETGVLLLLPLRDFRPERRASSLERASTFAAIGQLFVQNAYVCFNPF